MNTIYAEEYLEQAKVQIDVMKSTLTAIHVAMEVGGIDVIEYTDAVYGVYMMSKAAVLAGSRSMQRN